MTTATTTSIAPGDTLHIALHHAASTGARSAVGLAGFAGAELRAGGAGQSAGGAGQGAAGAGDAGDAAIKLTPLVESPLLAAGPLAVPATIGVQLFDLTVGGEVFTAFEERIIGRYTEFRSAMGWRYAGLYAVESQGLAHPFARAVVYVVDVPTGAEAQQLAESGGAPPAEIMAFGAECSTYKTDPGTWLWLEPRPLEA